ncbi:MAG: TlpA family protein disulfide reductase [Hydrogenimonas sp.]|nr:TlpA family protein disulfide reductase [Hydrogenimonas sp.]
MRFKILVTTLLAAAALTLTGCGEKKSDKTESIKKEEKPRTFELKDGNLTIKAIIGEEGISFNLSEPVVMLNFFATWCPPCKAEIPHLVSLQDKFRGKFKVIAVLVEENMPQRVVEKFKQNHEINYFLSNSEANIELGRVTADMLHQPRNFPIPLMVIFVKGKYFRHYVGMVPEEMLESDINDALKEAGK